MSEIKTSDAKRLEALAKAVLDKMERTSNPAQLSQLTVTYNRLQEAISSTKERTGEDQEQSLWRIVMGTPEGDMTPEEYE